MVKRNRHGGRNRIKKWPYRDERWTALRNALVYGPGVGCAICGCVHGRMDLHHDPPLTDQEREEKDVSAFDPTRLKVLCVRCHSGVTNGMVESELRRRSEWREFINEGV